MRVRVAVAGVVVAAWCLAFPPAASAEEIDCGEVAEDEVVQTDGGGRRFVEMQVAAAQQEASGAGVTVALVDAGVSRSNPLLPAVTSVTVAGSAELPDSPTLAAGLVAGGVPDRGGRPLGVAPGARIVSVRVYDGPGVAAEDGVELSAGNLAAGITAAGRAGADVIAVGPAVFRDDGDLRAAVRRVVQAGILVVAAVGQRPVEDQPGFDEYGVPRPSEDVTSFPAAYPGVLGVGSGSADGTYDPRSAFASSHIDVVAPVVGAVGTTANGSTCLVDLGSPTDLAAAVVAGVAALLVDKYGDETAAQVRARIEETASGSTDVRSPIDGYGVVQAGEALTRQLTLRPDGTVLRAVQPADATPPIPPPDPADDPFAALRGSLLWWAVLAGGGLVLALLLRPLMRGG